MILKIIINDPCDLSRTDEKIFVGGGGGQQASKKGASGSMAKKVWEALIYNVILLSYLSQLEHSKKNILMNPIMVFQCQNL